MKTDVENVLLKNKKEVFMINFHNGKQRKSLINLKYACGGNVIQLIDEGSAPIIIQLSDNFT